MMLGIVVFIILLLMEVGFMVYSLRSKAYQKDKKSVLNISLFVLLTILCLFGVIRLSFRWYILLTILIIKAAMGIWYLLRKNDIKVKVFKKRFVVLKGINNAILVALAILPAVIFPQFSPIEPTGEYKVKTISYTLTDPVRMETFSEKNENRKVTIQFWYPDDATETYPLVVFSHGSFGFRGSNASTFENLASNGYVVCSIDHTYHAFFTKQTDGKLIVVNNGFLNDAIAATNGDFDAQTTYSKTQEWLQIRLGDMNLVLNDILDKAEETNSDEVYHIINTDKIGLFGHSLGGAAAAELGRERGDIDAAIVIDGTMLGEEVGFENGKEILNNTPYPIPLLNIYNESHFQDATQNADTYDNMVATANAADARQVVVYGAGHLNFTDLPLFSPFLAGLLGTGEVDKRYCIETMNQIVLNYFNYYLKDAKDLNIKQEY
jgi:dienelactone hydrolase